MARGEDDDLPVIELVDAGPSERSARSVVVGRGARTAGPDDGPSGGARRHRWLAALGAGLVVAVLALLLVGGDDADEGAPDRASPRPTSGTTAGTPGTGSTAEPDQAPVGPVLLPPTEGWLVFADVGDGPWVVLDLGTGERRELPLPAGHDGVGSAIPVAGGLVISAPQGTWYVPVADPGPAVDLVARGIATASSSRDRVWVRGLPTSEGTTEQHLVDLQGRTIATRRHPALPASMAVDEGPVLEVGGQVFVVGEDGLRHLSTGTLPQGLQPTRRGSGDEVVLVTCTSQGRCGPTVLDVRTGSRRSPAALHDDLGRSAPADYLLSDEGELVELRWSGDGVALRWVGADDRLLAQGPIGVPEDPRRSSLGLPPVLLPDGAGLAVLEDTNTLSIVTPAADGSLARRSVGLGARVPTGALHLVTR